VSELLKDTHGPMQILFFEHFGFGGLIHYAHCLCQALSEQGVKVSLLTAENYELSDHPRLFCLLNCLPMWNPYVDSGTQLEGLSRQLERASKGLRYVAALCLTLLTIWRERPDIVHVSEVKFLPDLLIFLLSGRAKTVYTCHNVQRFSDDPTTDIVRTDQLWHRTQTWMYHLSDGVIFHSEKNVQDFQQAFGFKPSKYAVIPHGEYRFFAPDQETSTAEARQALRLDETRKYILFFGAIRRYKGLDVLLESVAYLHRVMPDIQLIVAGAPGREVDIESLHNKANQLGLADNISWHIGYVPQEKVHLYFYASDVIALPHRRVYDSGVLKAAQALGRPVVVTSTGGLSSAVEKGKAGLVVPPENPIAMAQALEKLLTDTKLAQTLAKRGQDLAHTEFNWTGIAERTKKFYQEVLELPCAY
jgi:D-inositol-3-phosphate glycosyltransferase